MHASWRKALTAAVVIAAAGLSLPGTAQASSPSVQIQLCNREPNEGVFEITGLNQHNARVSSPLTNIGGRQCRLIANWWWKTGQTVQVGVRNPSLHFWSFPIGSGERNGSTLTYHAG